PTATTPLSLHDALPICRPRSPTSWTRRSRYWPECLFHHAPLENAVAILQTGMLRSRNDPDNALLRDVAARDVNAARAHAHNSVRDRKSTRLNSSHVKIS